MTGGASGLGRAAAERFAREGATVVVADLDHDGAEAVAAALPDALAVHVDTQTAPRSTARSSLRSMPSER